MAMLKKHHSQARAFRTAPAQHGPRQQSLLYLKDMRLFCLRRSIFCPQPGLAEAVASRAHLAGIEVPAIDIVHCSQRWLLLQSPNFSTSFFRRLNAGKLGNPYDVLARVFKNFTALARLYGYFRPSAAMIFLEHRSVKVWISEDVFADAPAMPLRGGSGERDFVVAFLAMVEGEMDEWERVTNVLSVDETLKLLEWRSRLNRGSHTAVHASKEVFYRQNESVSSFEPSELGYNRPPICRSFQEADCSPLDQLKPELSCSVTIREEHCPLNQLGREVYGEQGEKHSIYEEKSQEGEFRRTKKKFALTSTSSTIEKFSEKWRSTIGKKRSKLDRPHSQGRDPVRAQLPESEPKGIQHELEGLFSDEQAIQFGVEGDAESLQRIVEEMEEVLIW